MGCIAQKIKPKAFEINSELSLSIKGSSINITSSIKYNGVAFHIIDNCLYEIKTQAIINPILKNKKQQPRSCGATKLGRELAERAGKKMLVKYHREIFLNKQLLSGTAFYTNAGKLKSSYIIHLIGPESEKELKICLKEMFQICEKLKIGQIAIPEFTEVWQNDDIQQCANIIVNYCKDYIDLKIQEPIEEFYLKQIILINQSKQIDYWKSFYNIDTFQENTQNYNQILDTYQKEKHVNKKQKFSIEKLINTLKTVKPVKRRSNINSKKSFKTNQTSFNNQSNQENLLQVANKFGQCLKEFKATLKKQDKSKLKNQIKFQNIVLEFSWFIKDLEDYGEVDLEHLISIVNLFNDYIKNDQLENAEPVPQKLLKKFEMCLAKFQQQINKHDQLKNSNLSNIVQQLYQCLKLLVKSRKSFQHSFQLNRQLDQQSWLQGFGDSDSKYSKFEHTNQSNQTNNAFKNSFGYDLPPERKGHRKGLSFTLNRDKNYLNVRKKDIKSRKSEIKSQISVVQPSNRKRFSKQFNKIIVEQLIRQDKEL